MSENINLMKFQTKIILLIATISVSIGLFSSLLVSRIMKEALSKQLEKQVIIIVQTLSDNIIDNIINGDVLHVSEAITKLVEQNKDIKFAYVMGFRNEIFAHTFKDGFPRDLIHQTPFLVHEPDLRHFSTPEGPILEIGYPFINGLGAHLHVGMNESQLFLKAKEARNSIFCITLIVALLGGFIGIFLSLNIVNPLTQLSKLIKAFGEGKETDEFSIDSSEPEVANLVQSFHQMVLERKQIVKALKESEEKYRILIESANDAIITVDIETCRIIGVNKKGEDLLGRPAEEIIGMHQNQLYSKDDSKNYKIISCEDIKKGKGIKGNILIYNKDGRQIPVEVSSSVIEFGSKKLLQGIFRDITSRKKAEDNLKKRLMYEKMLTDISSKALYVENINVFLDSSLAIIGKAFGVSRAYISKYNYDSDIIDNTFEWLVPGIKYQKEKFGSIETRTFTWFMEMMKKNQIINYKDIEQIPDCHIKEILQRKKIKSIVVAPLFIDEEYYGFIGLEEYHIQRNWLSEDLAILQTSAHIIAEAILHKRMENKLILLEGELLDISRKEQERIGHDLHDVLGQEFTGIACMSKVLEQKLIDRSLPEAESAANIVEHVQKAMHLLRSVIKALTPIANDPEGLTFALHELASNIENVFSIFCQFKCNENILINNNSTAAHLYYIAKEAINNAIKHGKAKHILISLFSSLDKITMSIKNDGLDFPLNLKNKKGKGLDIMYYRSKIIGASFDIRKNNGRGASINVSLKKSAVS